MHWHFDRVDYAALQVLQTFSQGKLFKFIKNWLTVFVNSFSLLTHIIYFFKKISFITRISKLNQQV